ncbi:MAG: hypothetical protein KAV82_13110 [Phycisphaerae bacterium]|nr:hypothetical protein [Phycisphaerae bacterium]
MFTKRSLIVGLVGLNLALAAVLIFSRDVLPTAYAARGGRPGDFAVCTVKVHKDFDAVYILDHQSRKLHCFVPSKSHDAKLTFVQTRDLESDIRRTD